MARIFDIETDCMNATIPMIMASFIWSVINVGSGIFGLGILYTGKTKTYQD